MTMPCCWKQDSMSASSGSTSAGLPGRRASFSRTNAASTRAFENRRGVSPSERSRITVAMGLPLRDASKERSIADPAVPLQRACPGARRPRQARRGGGHVSPPRPPTHHHIIRITKKTKKKKKKIKKKKKSITIEQ